MNRISRALCAAALCFSTLFSASPASAATLPPLPAADRSFDAGTLHVDVYGKGAQTLIFIPGLSSGPWSWSEQIAHFSPSYTVFALTLPGFSGRPFAGSPDLFAAFSADFWAMLNAQNVSRPVVIGHSLGGTLAIALAEQHPDRLRAAIALDGLPVFPMLAQSTAAERASAAKQMAAGIAAESHDQLLAYEVQYMKAIGTVDSTLVQTLAENCANSDPKAVAAWGAADLSIDLRPQLKDLKTPVLELMPYAKPSPYSEDQTLAFYHMLLAGAPNAKVEPIEGARHFAMVDQPAAVDSAITQFLGSVR